MADECLPRFTTEAPISQLPITTQSAKIHDRGANSLVVNNQTDIEYTNRYPTGYTTNPQNVGDLNISFVDLDMEADFYSILSKFQRDRVTETQLIFNYNPVRS